MSIIVKDGFDFFDNLKGEPETLIIRGLELRKQLDYLNSNKLTSIALECSELTDLEFLKELDFIEDVTLCNPLKNYEGLYYLTNLKRLTLNVERNKPRLDFTEFKNLVSLSVDWYSDFPDLSKNINLKKLMLWKFRPKSKSLEEVMLPENLEFLKITESNLLNFKGLNTSKLKHLEGHYCGNLVSLDGIKNISDSLEILILDYCKKLTSYDDLKNCKRLETIVLGDCGEMSSLDWLTQLSNVRHFSFWNTKINDGDLTPCFGIDYINFKDSRHYNHKLKDFNSLK